MYKIIKEIRKGRNQKCKRSEKEGRGKGKDKTSGIDVRFTDIGNGDPRNAVLSAEKTDPGSEENAVNPHRPGSFNLGNIATSRGMGE